MPTFDEDALPLRADLDLAAADDRTLRLSAPELTEEVLEGLMTYQEAFLGHAEADGASTEALARAHQKALAASGLSPKQVEQGGAVVRAYCAQRAVVARLRARRAHPLDADRARKLDEELRRLDRPEVLARRYGAPLVASLQAREPRLLALHERLQRVLGRP